MTSDDSLRARLRVAKCLIHLLNLLSEASIRRARGHFEAGFDLLWLSSRRAKMSREEADWDTRKRASISLRFPPRELTEGSS